MKSAAGWRPEVWKAFAEELGILGAPFAEDLGGLGGGPLETMVIMEEFGKALVVEPYLGTVVIGGGFLTKSGHPRAAELIGRIIAGEATFAFAYAEPQSRYNWADIPRRVVTWFLVRERQFFYYALIAICAGVLLYY